MASTPPEPTDLREIRMERHLREAKAMARAALQNVDRWLLGHEVGSRRPAVPAEENERPND
jgi:hypothetical protein